MKTKPTLMTKEEAHKWLIENKRFIINNVSFTKEKLEELFIVHNSLYTPPKQKTSCGTCVMDVKTKLKRVLDNIESKTEYHIYRNNFGYLTLSKTNKIAYSLLLNNETELKEKLEELKINEKNLK